MSLFVFLTCHEADRAQIENIDRMIQERYDSLRPITRLSTLDEMLIRENALDTPIDRLLGWVERRSGWVETVAVTATRHP